MRASRSRPSTPPRHREDALAAACRAAGLALTPQRLAIYRALRETETHPSPEGLYARVKGRMPTLSLATVYKTLEALVRVGLAVEVPATGKTKRYDANMAHHHHLICTGCGEVRDFYDPALDGVRPPVRLAGFVAHGVRVQVHGRCDACARPARSR
jgi:Fur family peroxide stress response transcriptional regulator